MVNVSPPSPQPEDESVARQTAVGSTYTIAASAITLVIGFTRSIILARLLFPEDFGLFALAFFFVRLLERVQMFGFTAAFIHKHDHTEEEAAAHFILRLGAGLLVLGLALLLTPILPRFYPDDLLLGPVIVVLTAVRLLTAFNATPKTILAKQLQFRRISVLKVGGSALAFVWAIWLAWAGYGIWALVAQEASLVVMDFFGLWLLKRPWSPSLKTTRDIFRYYFQFGKFQFVTQNIVLLLDTFDDFWIGTFLGSTPLGFYAKAYEFAHYPRAVVGEPISSVFFPAFARLQNNREQLSRAFFRVASLLVRAGFLFASLFVLVTPEFIRLFLGEKWLPMQLTFQLMLLYTLLDPLLLVVTQLVTAVGEPQTLTKAQVWQMVFFVPAVILASTWFGIEGVAVMADLMLLLGIVLVLPRLRHFVDFSLRQMIVVPALAVAVGLPLTLLLLELLPAAHPAVTLPQKALSLSAIYLLFLLIFERAQLQRSVDLIMQLLRR
jgi:O-antigen/teichoic acid export membrane protein